MMCLSPGRLTLLLRTLTGLLLLWLLGWMPTAHADSATCTGPTGMSPLSFGTVFVSPNAPAGTLVGPVVSTTGTFTCSKFSGTTSATFTATLGPGTPGTPGTPGSYDVDTPTAGVITFQTNLTGIALQLTPSNPNTSGRINNTSFPAGVINGSSPSYQTAQTYSAQLVKTSSGTTTAGSLQSFLLVSGYTMTYVGGSASFTQSGTLSLGSGTIKSGGCNVLNVTVTLPTVFTSQLGSVGATGGKTPVPINLTGCPIGASVSISFSGTPAVIGGASQPTVLSTSSTGSAAMNVGVQLLDSGNQPVDITGTVATPLGTPAASGNLSPSYSAQYYATGSVTPGTVNATATYTLTYQ